MGVGGRDVLYVGGFSVLDRRTLMRLITVCLVSLLHLPVERGWGYLFINNLPCKHTLILYYDVVSNVAFHRPVSPMLMVTGLGWLLTFARAKLVLLLLDIFTSMLDT